MLVASDVSPAGSWDESMAADQVVLDFNGRHRRRHAMTGSAGLAFLLDLPHAVALHDGDGLRLDDGRIVRVNAAPEPLYEIAAADLATLVRIAWHLGNRHLPTQLLAERLRIRRDHSVVDMVGGLGGKVTAVEAPFNPEGGAFDRSGFHSHEQAHP